MKSWLEHRLDEAARGAGGQRTIRGWTLEPIRDVWGGRIAHSSQVNGGSACIGDTRIAVWMLVERVLAGHAYVEIANGYPDLSVQDVEMAMHYLAVNPAEVLADLRDNEVGNFAEVFIRESMPELK